MTHGNSRWPSRHWYSGLGLGLAAIVAAPELAAEISGELYGEARFAVGYYDRDGRDGNTRAEDTNSHLGLHVNATEGDYNIGLVYERSLDIDDNVSSSDSVRQANIQLGSPFGTLTLGRAPTAYKTSGQALDPFYNTAIATITGDAFSDAPAAVLGPSYGLSALTSDTLDNGFINNQLAYTTPRIAGFTANAAWFVSEQDRSSSENHDWGAGIEWRGMGITAGVQYLDIKRTTSSVAAQNAAGDDENGLMENGLLDGLINPDELADTTSSDEADGDAARANFNAGLPVATRAARLYASYDSDRWGVSGSWEPLHLRGAPSNRDYYYAAGWLGITEKARLAAGVGSVRGTFFEGENYQLGLFHALTSNFEIHAVSRYTDRKGADSESYQVAVGAVYRFSLGRSSQ